MSAVGRSVIPLKEGRRVTKILLSWTEKSIEAKKEAFREHARPKVGRKARISGTVEHMAPVPSSHKLAQAERKQRQNDPSNNGD